MEYALIKDEIVVNLIWLHPMNADDFPNAVPIEDLPVQIGDTYIDGIFYRDGEEVKNEIIVLSEEEIFNSLMEEVSEYGY